MPEEPEDDVVWTTRRPVKDKTRSRKLAVGVGVLALATLLVLGWIAMTIIGFFSDSNKNDGSPPLVITQAVVPSSQQGTPSSTGAPAQAGPVKPSSVAVFNVAGDPDSQNKATLATDGDPNTAWRTDRYVSNFPALKPGIGLMLTFAQPVKLAQVTITSPSEGTVVEIRTAATDNPELSQTQVVGNATLGKGETQVPVKMTAPGQRVIVWLTKLTDGGRFYSAQINELKCTAAA